MKSRLIISILLTSLSLLFYSCNNDDNTNSNTTENNKDFILIGKRAQIAYPDFRAEVHYISESELHWKTINAQGEISEGRESISYKKLSKSLFFINWTETDGTTVSQVIDMKTNVVDAYITFSGTDGRGSNFINGTWTEIN